MAKEAMFGVLHFFSETGTEGGHWAFQSERYISKNKTRFSCTKCGRYWDKARSPYPPAPARRSVRETSPFPDECSRLEHDYQLVSRYNWSYEGLRVLQTGDYLIIYDKEEAKKHVRKVVWEGYIDLKRYDLFTEDVRGMWMHADQVGMERDEWAEFFFQRYPAVLIRPL